MSTDDDISQIAADDALLDALGHGEPAPDGDELATMLHAWRADLDAHLDAGQPLVGELLEGRAEPPDRAQTRRRASRLLTGIAAAILVFGGLAAGASQAGPDSPLWPLTKVMYPSGRHPGAEQAISRARARLAANRLDEAKHQLDVASALVGRLRDQMTSVGTDQIAQLRQLLAARTRRRRGDAVGPRCRAPPRPPRRGRTAGAAGAPGPQPTGGGGNDNPLPVPGRWATTLPTCRHRPCRCRPCRCLACRSRRSSRSPDPAALRPAPSAKMVPGRGADRLAVLLIVRAAGRYRAVTSLGPSPAWSTSAGSHCLTVPTRSSAMSCSSAATHTRSGRRTGSVCHQPRPGHRVHRCRHQRAGR